MKLGGNRACGRVFCPAIRVFSKGIKCRHCISGSHLMSLCLQSGFSYLHCSLAGRDRIIHSLRAVVAYLQWSLASVHLQDKSNVHCKQEISVLKSRKNLIFSKHTHVNFIILYYSHNKKFKSTNSEFVF